ncbi:MAG TPA: acyl-CoA dehydrogenase family protein, partial [Chloroflexota bacterium]|nr:acyl-CoA dehydrogenase family protein [Chloroflexota bacterium]
TAGLIEEALRAASADRTSEQALKAIEEYAMECSMAKVLGSEALGRVVDEGVQIFGGYGFMHEYPIEKAYRDARITRIFEGTNEINRLLLSGTLFRRAMDGRVAVMDAFPAIDAAMSAGQASGVDVGVCNPPAAREPTLQDAAEAVERARGAAIYTVMKAAMRYMMRLEEEQEFLAGAADMMINLFAIDSALSRAAAALRAGRPDATRHALTARLVVWRFLPGVRQAIVDVLENGMADGSAAERDEELGRVRAYLGDYDLASTPALHALASAIVSHGGYPFGVSSHAMI